MGPGRGGTAQTRSGGVLITSSSPYRGGRRHPGLLGRLSTQQAGSTGRMRLTAAPWWCDTRRLGEEDTGHGGHGGRRTRTRKDGEGLCEAGSTLTPAWVSPAPTGNVAGLLQ